MVYITIHCITNVPLYLAAVQEMEAQLPATPSQFSLSISLFVLIQGLMPLFWTTISEVKGRKVSHIEVVICVFKLNVW